jgi:hypothetical protein
MSLHQRASYQIPEETQRVARAALGQIEQTGGKIYRTVPSTVRDLSFRVSVL